MQSPFSLSSLPATGRLILLLGATTAAIVSASPVPRNAANDLAYSYLLARDNCATTCGADKQFCCTSNQACTTLAGNVATCVPAGGSYGGYTTTWTETRTYTSTVMTNWNPAPAPTPGVDCKPQSPEQEPCGSICCAGWQTCAAKGQCSSRPGYQEPTAIVVTSNGVVTTQYSAPYRVIGTTTIVNSGARSDQASNTATATTTSASSTSTSDGDTIGADGSNKGGTGGGLSGGAIAGIVIGTLAGVALLMLLCFCCIARGIWNAIFGGKKEKNEKTIIEEDIRYSRHGSRAPSAYSRRDRHSGWFGGRPSSAADRREKKSGGNWWLGIAGGATALLALLTLRKKDKKPARGTQSSRYTDSSYTYSDATHTNPSSSSSGRRTHRTARTERSYRSGRSRDSRGGNSYYSRAASRRP